MAPAPKTPLGFATRSVHGDTGFASGREVAPNISLTTTFRQPTPAEILAIGTNDVDPYDGTRDIYSRYTTPTLTRVEKVLSSVIGQPTLLYPSGLAATFATLLHYKPDTIAITDGYHGCHDSFRVYQDTRGIDATTGKNFVSIIKLDDAYPTKGLTLCWVETPLNPTGECRSIEFYAKKVHALGGILAVDSTFGPPPLQDPFAWGADIVMHSATKYFGGHSDALTGTLSVRTKGEWMKLWHNRTYTGATPGGLESWLILRSLRTLNLRVVRQSKTATDLAQWLASLTRAAPGSDLDGPAGMVEQVWHATLQDGGGKWVGEGKQMSGGSACFGIMLSKATYANQIGHILELFTPATSLGGVESLIEQRFLSDPGSDPRLVRISVGLEDFEDLKEDMKMAFRKLLANERAATGKI